MASIIAGISQVASGPAGGRQGSWHHAPAGRLFSPFGGVVGVTVQGARRSPTTTLLSSKQTNLAWF